MIEQWEADTKRLLEDAETALAGADSSTVIRIPINTFLSVWKKGEKMWEKNGEGKQGARA